MDQEPQKHWTDDDDLLARYVLGQVTPEEKGRLEAELEQNEAARERVRTEMSIAAGIRRHGRDLLKAQLRTKLRRSRATQFMSFQYIGLAAAVLLIAIGIGAYQIWFSELKAPKEFHHPQEVVLKEDPASEEQRMDEAEVKEEATEVTEAAKNSAEAATKKKELPTERRIASTNAAGPSAPVTVPEASLSDAATLSATSEAAARPRSIWLIGTVVMVSERSSANTGGRTAREAGITLRHQAIAEMPQGLAKAGRSSLKQVQTLLERNAQGLRLTLYGESVKEEDLQQAVVERMTDDSLVVALPHQRITFRLPEGWNVR